MEDATTLRIEGLTQFDIDMLREELQNQGADPADLEAQPLADASPDKAGDFGLTAVTLVIGLATVKAVAAWLVKHRSRSVAESVIETFDDQGRLVRRETIRHESQRSSSASPEELRALGELTNIDPNLLTALH